MDYQRLDDSFLPTRKDIGVSWLEMTWKTVCFRPYVSGGQCNAAVSQVVSLANSQAFA